MAIGKEGNVKWVDGFRGLASSTVVITHLTRSFDLLAFDSTNAEGTPQRVVQWPFVRVFTQGRIGVAIFALVTGYVCALKPLKLSRQGNQEAAFKSMGKSALRRVPRLVLPAAFATFLTWIACELGAFYVAKHCDSWWIRETGPGTTNSSAEAIQSLINNLISTWTHGGNQYDANQWTMLPLLKSSMEVYVFMLTTGHIRPRYRMMAAWAMWLYFYFSNEPTFGMQVFFGVFLAELQNIPAANQFLVDRRSLCRVLSGALLFFGMFIASYPEAHAEWVPWSHHIQLIFDTTLPLGSNYPRFGTSIGLHFITLGLHFSPWTRDVLSNRAFLWLGKQSFAVYLLHGPLIRSVLAWLLFGFETLPDTQDENGQPVQHMTPFPGLTKLFLLLPIFIPLVYACAVAWTTYVDPWCANFTERLVNHVTRQEEEKPEPLLPA